jgi:hypothetical protein
MLLIKVCYLRSDLAWFSCSLVVEPFLLLLSVLFMLFFIDIYIIVEMNKQVMNASFLYVLMLYIL